MKQWYLTRERTGLRFYTLWFVEPIDCPVLDDEGLWSSTAGNCGNSMILDEPPDGCLLHPGQLQEITYAPFGFSAKEMLIPNGDRKSTRLNSSHCSRSRMPSSA